MNYQVSVCIRCYCGQNGSNKYNMRKILLKQLPTSYIFYWYDCWQLTYTKQDTMAKYSKSAQKNVASAVKRMEKGTLKSGRSNKKVTDPKQAIAIGLAEAREKGAKVPRKKATKKSTSPAKKTAGKKADATNKKTAAKRAVPKKAAPKKKAAKKIIPEKKDSTINASQISQAVNSNLPPVEERSGAVIPVLQEKPVDPITVTDKKALEKAVAKHDPKHNIQLSGPKTSIRPSGKKPLWR